MEQPEDEEQEDNNVDNSKSLSSRVDEEFKLEPQPAVVEAASNLQAQPVMIVVEKSSLLVDEELHGANHRPENNPGESHLYNNQMIPARPPAQD